MKIISKILSLLLVCFMTICLCGCEIEDDNKDKKAGLTLGKMKGTWTTVGYSNAPSSVNPIWLAQVSFWIDTEYDGGERWYNLSSRQIRYYSDINLNGSTLIDLYGWPILNIISYRESEMDIQLFSEENPELPNAILTMKKFGSGLINDDDYKFKLINGIWLNYDGQYFSCEAYEDDDYDLKSIAKGYGGNVLINFHQDGTGKFAYYHNALGTRDYTFDWKLENKILTIQIDGKEERQSKVTLVSIDGEVVIRFENPINIWKDI